MSINWDDVLDNDTGAGDGNVPPGPYTARVAEASGHIAQSGNPYVKVKFEIVGGPSNGNPVWTNIVMATGNPKAMSYTLRKFHALGVTREWLRENKPSETQIAEALQNAAPVVDIDVVLGDEYEGERRPEVKNIKKAKENTASVTTLPHNPTPPSGPRPTPTPHASDMPKPNLPAPAPAAGPQDTPEPF